MPWARTMPSMTDDFERYEVDAGSFSHEHHVGVAFEMLRRHAFLTAACRYADIINTVATRAGAGDKFNATITVALLSIIAERMNRRDYDDALDFMANNRDLADTKSSDLALFPGAADERRGAQDVPASRSQAALEQRAIIGGILARGDRISDTMVLPPKPVTPAYHPNNRDIRSHGSLDFHRDRCGRVSDPALHASEATEHGNPVDGRRNLFPLLLFRPLHHGACARLCPRHGARNAQSRTSFLGLRLHRRVVANSGDLVRGSALFQQRNFAVGITFKKTEVLLDGAGRAGRSRGPDFARRFRRHFSGADRRPGAVAKTR